MLASGRRQWMSRPAHPVLLILALAGQAADALSYLAVVARFGPATDLNPLAVALSSAHGPLVVVVPKLLAVLALVLGAALLGRWHHRLLALAALFIAAIGAFGAATNLHALATWP